MNKTLFSACDAALRFAAFVLSVFFFITLKRANTVPKTYTGVQMGFVSAMLLHCIAALVIQLLHLFLLDEDERPLAYDDFLLNLFFFADIFVYNAATFLEALIRLQSKGFHSGSKTLTLTLCAIVNILLKAGLICALVSFVPSDEDRVYLIANSIEMAQLWIFLSFVAFAAFMILLIHFLVNSRIKETKDSTAPGHNSHLNRLTYARQLFTFHVFPSALLSILALGFHSAFIYLLKDFEGSAIFSSLIYSMYPIAFALLNGLGTTKMRSIFVSTLSFWVEYREMETKVRPFHENDGEVAVSQLYAIGVL
uniref:G_PROTEIN_RECEP_F1_2 domain-containing protein n=1 Tax=Steinernema glaseri TaxID=37863 RepID=A0A1I7YQW4_9BILA